MAKRKKQEIEEDVDFEFPEFDKVEYMKGEINKGKSVLMTMAIAPIFSYLSLFIFELTMEWTLGFIMFIPGLFLLGPAHNLIKVDVSQFGKKEYFMNGAMFFVTWFVVWIILMNPPFNDFAAPSVQRFEVTVQVDDQWIPLDQAELVNGEIYMVNITAKITDNVEVRQDSIRIQVEDELYEMEYIGNHRYRLLHEMQAWSSPYNFQISMEDVNGNDGQETFQRVIGS